MGQFLIFSKLRSNCSFSAKLAQRKCAALAKNGGAHPVIISAPNIKKMLRTQNCRKHKTTPPNIGLLDLQKDRPQKQPFSPRDITTLLPVRL